jgi:hypothetical protein
MSDKMYEGAKTWSPFVGCRNQCCYCLPSFQRQMRRRKHHCELCGLYIPHFHPERLGVVPSARLIFACAFGDIAFASCDQLTQILSTSGKHDDKTFLLQSKDPAVFATLSGQIPGNVVLGTTIETNRPTDAVSVAPPPISRTTDMEAVPSSRKYVTIEPILDFDPDTLIPWIERIKPEFVYVGYDNHHCKLDEPKLEKTLDLMQKLAAFTEVRPKKIRGAWYEQLEKAGIPGRRVIGGMPVQSICREGAEHTGHSESYE